MALKNFLLAGFGGQGILFSGKVIAYSGLMDGKEVSWLPSSGLVSGCFDGNESAVF